jgi:transcription termination/antitermination protein NusG
MNYKWYVLKVTSGREEKIKSHIEMEVEKSGLADSIRQVIVAIEKVVQLRNGKKITKEKNFYPGYILIEAVLDSEVEHVITNLSGVYSFLGNKNEPIPMRKSEINRILGRLEEVDNMEEQIELPFLVGEPVKIIDGPFSGFNGFIEEINEEKKKLKVIVKIFGRRTPVELNYMQVEKS